MTLEELSKALGLDTEENKEKFGILKKEYNAMSKAQKDSAKKIETLEAQIEENKPMKSLILFQRHLILMQKQKILTLCLMM